MNLIDHTENLTDFSETAALIDNLDLIITVDTAVAHLAGALAKPVFVLLGFVPAWRWLLDRSDSPWYPTMRLFRQTKIDDWTAPIAHLARALQEFTKK
jgi:ADP-heptose:LPS heptosyltransferase